MVSYIKSDLQFILDQIKIAEAHAGGQPLYGPGGLIPTYNLSWGLRTVDGTYNNLLHPEWGAADNEFPEHLGTIYRPADGTPVDFDGPGGAPPMPTAANYNPSTDPNSIVVDSSVRTISNLLVDQTLGNPSAILTALQRAGIVAPANQMAVTAQISAAYAPLRPLFNELADAERANAEAQAAASASPNNQALQDAAAATAADVAAAQAALDAEDDDLMLLLDANGVELEGANVVITNLAPDEGLSASFNSWFTLFGQFFDHGLDLVGKGGSGTVFIPLQPDDPLYDPTSPTNFMVLTRATTAGPGADGIMGTPDDTDRPVNTTTAFVDQNQTYTSHPSHQVFLREYALNAAGDPVATGKLIEGGNGGMATWADLKAQARDLLGIQLVDANVGNVPLLATDPYGEFIRGPNGYPQIVTATGLVEGDPTANGGLGVLVPENAFKTGHAFLADIAHNAVPDGLADGDIEIGLNNPGFDPGAYDNELLDAHYVAGDGRANENIGLTAVHHVFHSEHNRLVEHTKEVVLQTNDLAFLNEWLAVDVAALPTTPAQIAALVWDGERVFQAAKFGTEMQYQHLVFEEFARKIQPNINVFLVPDGFDVTIDPSIVAEFAHVVYRFGHSMLTETIDRFDPTFTENDIGLIEGFLNPLQFETNGTNATVDADIAAGAIVRGMTRQVGNEIDEFVTSALRNNLLGLPLDLATINLARGRDTGVPSLNEARAQFYAATNQDALLKPYESWVDFAGHLKHEASIINFIAAYGTHSLITSQTTIEGKRDAALTIVTGVSVNGVEVPADRLDFLNATGAYAGGTLGGLNTVDLWIGGLAEAIMPFGGMLGSTFNFVFEIQMEKLQSGDRFYYLQRLDGLHLFSEMENNSFAAMIMRNTDATHLPSDVFSTPGLILEVDQTKQFNDLDGDGDLETDDPVGAGILTPDVIRNDPGTAGPDSNYLRYTGGEHVVLGGTDANNTLIAGIGDDTLFGDGGNDRLEGGFGNDIINAGDGDDIITDSGGDDNIKAGAGNDVVHAGPGLDLVMGNTGQDFIFLGTDMGSEVFAGEGNDFIYGNKNAERILGNEGDDWIETGTFDGAPGDNFDEIFAHDAVDGNDVFIGDGGFDEFIGEGGDDVMVGSAGRGKMAGMSGFDWATYKDNALGVNANLNIPIIFDESPTLPENAALDEFESMEGLSGSRHNDRLTGSEAVAADRLPTAQGGTEGYAGSALDAQGIALINGLQALLGAGVTSFSAGDVLLGGDGSDIIEGLAGDDIIDGDKWLDVQIGVFAPGDTNHTGTPIALHNSMTSLAASMFAGTINPGQLAIVRTIRNSADQTDSDGLPDIDVAVFSDNRANYDITNNADGSITVAHNRGTATDGADTLRNVETLRFLDGDLTLSAPVLQLDAFDNGQYLDQFNATTYTNSNGVTPWTTAWTETSDLGGNIVTGGQIRITGNQLVFRDDDNDAGNGTATIQRGVNLQGATSATISYEFDENNFDAGEILTVVFSRDGTALETVQTLNSNSGEGTQSFNLTGPFTANAFVRFVVSGTNNNSFGGDNIEINNVAINFVRPAAVPARDFATNFTEGGDDVAIASGPLVTDADGTTLVSAKITLTNAELDDELIVGTLPAGITSSIDLSVSGQVSVNLTGTASFAAYQAAIQAVSFANNSQSPIPGARVITVTVSDPLFTSAPATSTVTVVAVNDAPLAADDSVITNVTTGSFLVPEWVMLANDEDPEGAALNVTGATENDGSFSIAVGGTGDVTVTATNTANHDFTYTVSDGAVTDTADVDIVWDTVGEVTGNGGNNTLIGNTAGSSFNGLGGNDMIFAGAGNDTIIQAGNTGGRDYVDGGANTDTYQLNGAAGAETFTIYSRTAAEAAFLGVVLNVATEIVIARNGVIIAELNDIEEIRVNTLLVTSPPGTGGTNGGDTIQVVGSFAGTSLDFNTITIDGNSGDDTVDITALSSAHRIFFKSNGGNDTVVGVMRPQDVIELAPGMTSADYDTVTDENGVTTMTSLGHSLTFVSAGGLPQVVNGVDPTIYGTSAANRITGTAGDDRIDAGAGRDLVFGAAGKDTFVAHNGDGNDTYFGDGSRGGNGVDTLDMSAITAKVAVNLGSGSQFRGSATGGAGSDTLVGIENVITGSGADTITASTAVNVMAGGGGNDTFRFVSVAAANGDTILDFQAGDVLDLSGIDANSGARGNQAFTLVPGAIGASAQLMVTTEHRADGDYTVVHGNTGGSNAVEFKINIKGDHDLDATDFRF